MNCELVFISSDNLDSTKKPEFEVVQEFSVKDYSDAAKFVKQYNSEHTDHVYYWRQKKDKIGIWHEDGICSYRDSIGYDFWDDVDEFFVNKISKLRKKYKHIKKNYYVSLKLNDSRKKNELILIVRKIANIRWFWGKKSIRFLVGSWIWLLDNLEYYLWEKWRRCFIDFSFDIRNVRNFKKTGHAISEHWGLAEHLLGDLKYNLKNLIEVKSGVSFQFIDEVVKDEHKDDPNFDFDKWFEKNYNIPDEIHEKANARCNETYQHIIDLIDKYAFYAMTGPEPDKEYPNIVLEGSYDELDYKKMNEISVQCWNEIWDLVKKYGNSMGD